MVELNCELLSSILKRDESRKESIEYATSILQRMADNCKFSTCVVMPNVELKWISPVVGYVAQFKKAETFKAEPFLIDMFRGVSILPISNTAMFTNVKLVQKMSWILNGTIHERSPRVFDPTNPDESWIPSLGDNNSYVGIYSAHINEKQACIICDSGLDYQVLCQLQRFFVEQEDAGKTYGEVFSSQFIDNIRWYTIENRRRIIHTAANVLGVIIGKIPSTLPIEYDEITITEDKNTINKVSHAIFTYCSGNKVNRISPYFKFPTTNDVRSDLQGYPLGPILNKIKQHHSVMYTAILTILNRKFKAVIDIIMTDTVQRDQDYNCSVECELEYNYIDLFEDTGTFYSGCMSTFESRGRVFMNSRIIYGPTIFLNGSNFLERTTHWNNSYHNAFPICTPDTGLNSSDSIVESEYQRKFFSMRPLIDNNFFNTIRHPIDKTITDKLGFKSSGLNNSLCCQPIIVKLSN